MEINGYTIRETWRGGKAGRGRNATASIQVLRDSLLIKTFRFTVGDEASKSAAFAGAYLFGTTTKGRPAMTTDEAFKILYQATESPVETRLGPICCVEADSIRVLLAELAALREAAGRLADQLTVSPEQRQLAHDALLRDEYQPLYGILASWLNLTMPSVVKSITPWLVPSLRPFEEGSNATH